MHSAQSHACPSIALFSLTTARRCPIAAQPYLKYHNPRTFEDLSAPVPNFRSLALKAGDVPKFFDSVLVRRADDAVTQVRHCSSSHQRHGRGHARRQASGQHSMKGSMHALQGVTASSGISFAYGAAARPRYGSRKKHGAY